MGYKSASTRRTSAASAVSSQAVVVNTGTGFSAVGSTIAANTSISLGVTTVGQTSAATTTTIASGPVIGNIQYLDTNNAVVVGEVAVSTAGGNILINGTGFVANSSIYINNTLASNTFISSTQIRAVCPAASAGNVTLMIFTPTNVGTISTNGVRYSGAPSWTTAAVSFQNGASANVALVASSDSTLTYTLQAGSTLPTGISLVSVGYLSGTATGYSNNTSSTVVIVATDAEGQATQQTINITVTVFDPQFPYTTLLLNGETSVTPFIADASTNNFGLTIAGDTKATKFSPYRGDGYYSVYNSTASSYLGFSQPALGNTFTIEMWVYPLAAGNNTYYYVGGSGSGPLIGYNATTFSVAHQGGWSVASSVNPTLNSWNHIALVREGTGASQFKLYLNGTLTGTGTDATTFGVQTTGAIGGTGGTSQVSYISNFRIVNNQVLYTGNFTPSTTPLTSSTVGASGANVAASITGTTVMMAAQSATFVDKSASPITLTPSGTPMVSPAIPFAANSSYATYGSAYFDGVGDYLTVTEPGSASAGTDVTVECWVYPTNITARNFLVSANTVSGAGDWAISIETTGAVGIWIDSYSAARITTSTTLALNQWHHLALVKSSGTVYAYVNGVRDASTYVHAAAFGGSSSIAIGAYNVTKGSLTFGYLGDVRYVRGTAIYTGATVSVPTAPLLAVANTQLLTCQYNGGANNYGIIDNSQFNNVLTRNGNATQGSFSPYSPTGWSNYFVTSGNYISTPATHTAFAASTQDFTIECWIYLTAAPGTHSMVCGWGNANFDYLEVTNSGFDTNMNNTYTVGASFSWTLGTWYHIAVSRISNVNYCFINGNLIGSGITNSQSFGSGTTALRIGDWVTTPRYPFPGYISNFRFIAGTGLYNASFTPSTTPLTAVANTKLLTCQSNRFVDNSSNNYAITVTGTPPVQAFSPFSPSVAYTPSLHGGSAYFDGTGDYLSTASSTAYALGTSDFTIELWYNTTAKTNLYPVIISNGNLGANKWQLDDRHNTNQNTKLIFGVYNAQTAPAWLISTSVITNGQWYHVAIVRSGSTFTLYLNGVAESTQTYAGSVDGGAAQTIYVGQDAGQAGTNYNGSVADVRILKYAAYSGAFTPPTAPLTSPVTTPAQLLLNFTNGGIIDSHGSNTFETVSGAQVGTSVKKYGAASIYFPGASSNSLQFLSTSQAIAFGTGDFTVECWVNFATNNGTYNPFVRYDSSGTFDFGYDFSTTQLKYSGSAAILAVTQTFTVGTWYHVAVTRASGSSRLFVNGTQVGTTATGDTNNYAAGAFKVGGSSYSTGHVMSGYIDDLRVTKGFARYTANFTAPTTGLLGQ
jgi:hypothetical protein